MARISRSSRNPGSRRTAARIGVLATAAMTVAAVAGGAAVASSPSIQASASASGALITVGGTVLTGGQATASVDTSVPNAKATGTGTVLTQSDTSTANTATANPDTVAHSCFQGGSAPSNPALALTVGVACSDASASNDSAGSHAVADGDVAELTVGLNGVLSPILGTQPSSGSSDSCNDNGTVGQLLNTVCTVLTQLGSNAPVQQGTTLLQGINQALQNLYNVVVNNLDNTIEVYVGPANASVNAAADASSATAVAHGSTLDIKILPGVGCIGSVTECIPAVGSDAGNAPLIEIEVSAATATSTFNGTSWTTSPDGSLASVHLNIPGANQDIELGPNVCDHTLLGGTPLQTTISLGCATTSGATTSAKGADVELLESSAVPGGSSSQGLVSANLGSSSVTTANTTAVVPASSPSSSPKVTPTTVAAAPAVQTASVVSPTSVHTGEWWAGSMPLLVLVAMVGGGLLGWPRIRRMSFVSRLVQRSHR